MLDYVYYHKLMTPRYNMTASDKIIQSILSYKLNRPVSILRLPKEKEYRQKQQIQNSNLTPKSNKVRTIH